MPGRLPVGQVTLAVDPWSWPWRARGPELAAEEGKARARFGLEPSGTPSGDWSYLLTGKQRSSLEAARAADVSRHGLVPPGVCYDLTQSPAYLGHAYLGVLTLRRASSRMWSPREGCWLLPRERLAIMGFPVFRDLADAALVPEDAVSLNGPASAVGNAMHVASVGAILAVALVCGDLAASAMAGPGRGGG